VKARATLILGLLAALLLWNSAYIVDETQQVIVTQFGKPVGEAVAQPGLHFKVPLIQVLHYFDKRYLEWDGDPNQVPTRDKRFIWIDGYARWRITDPLLFFQRLRDERGAQSRLDDILDGEARTAVASHDLVELVRTTNREYPFNEEMEEDHGEFGGTITQGRLEISRQILAAAQQRSSDLGIEVLDFRFKRINYNEEVRRKVYDRMISERRRIADRYRSEGQGEAARITGERERDLKLIQSQAYREAQEILGRADAEATRIYAEAYDQSQASRDFYAFLQTMETYLETFSKETALVLSTEGDFYQFLSKIE
jgi:modulator of FtsH protease HflC